MYSKKRIDLNSDSDSNEFKDLEVMYVNNLVGQIFPTKESLKDIKFHIICNEAELMSRIQVILKYKGFIHSWDRHGQLTIYLDGQNNLYKSLEQINRVYGHFSVLKKGTTLDFQEALNLALDMIIEKGFRTSHKGTTYLSYILAYLFFHPAEKECLSKGPYQSLSKDFNITIKTIDRSIRYASQYIGLDYTNSILIYKFIEEFLIYIKRKTQYIDEKAGDSSSNEKESESFSPIDNKQISFDI